MKAVIVAALALLLGFPTMAGAQALDADARLQDAVGHALRSFDGLTIFDDVTAQVQHDVVILAGQVTIPAKKDEIGRRARAVPGVQEVRNEIHVLPVSMADDAIRRRVARAIYGHPVFYRYAAMPHPPIHILVEHGRVTLTGVVPTELDRALAHSLAAGSGEGSVTCALKTAAEARGSYTPAGSS